MGSPATLFEDPALRFATADTLITVYPVADRLVRRGPPRGRSATPRWIKLWIVASLTAFYLLIGPAGGAWGGGTVNLAGVALAGVAVAWRVGGFVRYPDLAGRGLLYLALPLATGVPWGLLVLSVPAWGTSAWCCLLAERTSPLPGPLPRYRLLPGVW